jgi:fatty-acyl-CoA synthase
MLALMFACARIGAILVPLNWRLAPPEHLYILKNAGVKVLFCEDEFAEGTETIDTGLDDCRVVAMGDEFEQFVAAAPPDTVDPAVGPEDPLLIVYTSGTTGRPKGAVLTQNAMIFNAVNSIAMHDMTSNDVIFTNLPMFHVGGLNIQTTPALHAGATVIMHRRFDPDATVDVIRDEKPTLMILVPALMAAVMQHPGLAGYGFFIPAGNQHRVDDSPAVST